jgi:hypothetical protein
MGNDQDKKELRTVWNVGERVAVRSLAAFLLRQTDAPFVRFLNSGFLFSFPMLRVRVTGRARA